MKNGKFGLVCFIEIVAAVVHLMLGFWITKLDFYNMSYGPFSGTTTGYPVLTPYTVVETKIYT